MPMWPISDKVLQRVVGCLDIAFRCAPVNIQRQHSHPFRNIADCRPNRAKPQNIFVRRPSVGHGRHSRLLYQIVLAGKSPRRALFGRGRAFK